MPTTSYLIRRAGLTALTDWEPFPYAPTPVEIADMAAMGYELAIVTWAGVVTNVTVENPWTFANMPNVQNHYDAGVPSSLTATGNALTGIADLSGNNRHMTGSATTGTVSINGMNALVVNNGDLVNYSPHQFGTQNSMFFYVGRRDPAHNSYMMGVFQDGGSRILMRAEQGNAQFSHNNVFQFASLSAGIPDTDWHVWGGWRNGTEQGISRDGYTATDARGANPSGYNRTFIFGGNSNAVAAQCVFVSGYSADDFNRGLGYLSHKFGLQAKLNPTHPYKDNPPTVLETA